MTYKTIVSRNGTRHIVGVPLGQRYLSGHRFRITCLCGWGANPNDTPAVAVRDCQFCLRELAEVKKRAENERQAIA